MRPCRSIVLGWAALVGWHDTPSLGRADEPAWTGRGKYRLLVRVDPKPGGGRATDEAPAGMRIDFAQALHARHDYRDAVDFRSVTVVRYDPATGQPLDDGRWAYGQSPADRPFRWYDAAIPEAFPEVEVNLSATEGRLQWVEHPRWGHFYDVVGDGQAGRLAWVHTQVNGAASYYAIYFDLLPRGQATWHAAPRGWIGDGSHRTAPRPGTSTGLIHTRIDVNDWDGDGLSDLIAGCSRGGMVWYKNLGAARAPAFASARLLFTNDGMPVDVGWGSSPRIVDWDGDGAKDVLSGAERNCVVWYRNLGSECQPELEYQGLVRTDDGLPLSLPIEPVPEGDGVYKMDYYPVLEVVDWDADRLMDLLAGGYITGRVYLYKNLGTSEAGTPRLKLVGPIEADDRTLDVGWCGAPSVGDIDGNGLFDLVSGTMKVSDSGGDRSSAAEFLQLYTNSGTPVSPRLQRRDWPIEGQFPNAALGTPRFADLNADELLDLVVSSGDAIYWYPNVGKPNEPRWRVDVRPLESSWGSESLSLTQAMDWDRDGQLDAIDGHRVALNAARGNPGLFGSWRSVVPVGQTIDHQSSRGDGWSYPRLYDFDLDGAIDCLEADHDGHVWWHRNRGTTDAPDFDTRGVALSVASGELIDVGPDESAAPFDQIQGSRAAYVLADFDQSGDNDLAIANFAGIARYFRRARDAGEAVFLAPLTVADLGIRAVPCAIDWDQDGWLDIVANSTPDRLLFVRNRGPAATANEPFDAGVWIDLPGAPYGAGAPCVIADWNGDGDEDLILQTAYGYTTWVERSFLDGGYQPATMLGPIEKRAPRE
jgi:hypothetical protein